MVLVYYRLDRRVSVVVMVVDVDGERKRKILYGVWCNDDDDCRSSSSEIVKQVQLLECKKRSILYNAR